MTCTAASETTEDGFEWEIEQLRGGRATGRWPVRGKLVSKNDDDTYNLVVYVKGRSDMQQVRNYIPGAHIRRRVDRRMISDVMREETKTREEVPRALCGGVLNRSEELENEHIQVEAGRWIPSQRQSEQTSGDVGFGEPARNGLPGGQPGATEDVEVSGKEDTGCCHSQCDIGTIIAFVVTIIVLGISAAVLSIVALRHIRKAKQSAKTVTPEMCMQAHTNYDCISIDHCIWRESSCKLNPDYSNSTYTDVVKRGSIIKIKQLHMWIASQGQGSNEPTNVIGYNNWKTFAKRVCIDPPRPEAMIKSQFEAIAGGEGIITEERLSAFVINKVKTSSLDQQEWHEFLSKLCTEDVHSIPDPAQEDRTMRLEDAQNKVEDDLRESDKTRAL